MVVGFDLVFSFISMRMHYMFLWFLSLLFESRNYNSLFSVLIAHFLGTGRILHCRGPKCLFIQLFIQILREVFFITINNLFGFHDHNRGLFSKVYITISRWLKIHIWCKLGQNGFNGVNSRAYRQKNILQWNQNIFHFIKLL